jgi:hypothetical protein
MTTSKDEEVVVAEEPKKLSPEEELIKITRTFIAVFDQMGIMEMRVRPEHVNGAFGSILCELDTANNGYILRRVK